MNPVIKYKPVAVVKYFPLAVKLRGGRTFDFLVTESIPVKCESKPERSLKVSVK